MKFWVCAAWFAFLVFQPSIAGCQAPPTPKVLARMTMIQSRYFRGTTFSLDVDQREYWVTAKHILTGAKKPPYGSVTTNSVSLKILDPSAQNGREQRWLSVDFSVIDPGKDIDIVVLAPHAPFMKYPPPSVPADSVGIVLGGDCEFLGFPYGGGWRGTFANGQSYWMPFIKHCTVSASPEEGLFKIWVLDGINNEGFSGGPVIFNTGDNQKIFAVVSGYHQEPAEIVSSAVTKKTPTKKPSEVKKPAALHANVNSGFIITYDIGYAMDAIKKNPIGPLR